MVRPKDRAKKKVFYRTPGGSLRIRTKGSRKHIPSCAVCKANLKGTTYSRSSRKTERRPERPFGGCLCHKCTERIITYRARVKDKDMKIADVPILFQQYL